MKRIALSLLLLCSIAATNSTAQSTNNQDTFSGHTVASEGAWCWFADPRATHYESEDGTLNMTYVGYIDVHGNIKATQYNWNTMEKNDVLVRSYFQPDDHNNPTFLVLPDKRVLIIYSRHTDEPAFYYRISVRPGDITQLGEEKCIKTSANTTYPSPFWMSDDPEHWYLCWRGISWHPTIARLTLPDENDDVKFDWGPRQMVQSTGARPYAKYYSNGKDKLYAVYTTGHPDNESPNWLYFNVININGANGEPTLEDIKGNTLSTIASGPFSVNKTSAYKTKYPYTVVDAPSAERDWVWQIALDSESRPCIAMVKINSAKTVHNYYYAKWTGEDWRLSFLANGGGKFHPSNTEYCYSGGEALDQQNPGDIYLSMPTTGTNGSVFEIWKYTVGDDGTVSAKEQITRNSRKNNVRPFLIPNSQGSKMRLGWMNGDYYYWMVKKDYPLGYPTSLMCDYDFESEVVRAAVMKEGWTLLRTMTTTSADYTNGMNISLGNGIQYGLDAKTHRPYVTINGTRHDSQNQLYTSDNWAKNSSGTSGDNWPTQMTQWTLALAFDGSRLWVYRNGLIDQVIDTTEPQTAPADALMPYYLEQREIQAYMDSHALEAISLPPIATTDIVLPASVNGEAISWTSSDESVIDAQGTLCQPSSETTVTLTATTTHATRSFTISVPTRNLEQNLLAYYDFSDAKDRSGRGNDLKIMGNATADGTLNLTKNTASGFTTNGYALVPAMVMDSLRSYSILFEATPQSLASAPRFYDFGCNSANSLFCRVNAFSAGIKYAGGTTTMTNSAKSLSVGQTYKIAVTFDARSRETTIYLDGEKVASGTENQSEPYQISASAPCERNYLGRTQWWDSNYASDNVDYCGTMDEFRIYNIALTQEEVCALQGVTFQEQTYPTALTNGDFEGQYQALAGSGVSSDRAIYVPEGWQVQYQTRNQNDLNALANGDLYYSQFFASKPQNTQGGSHTLWIRQRWGESVLGYYQEIRLPEGKYTLTADVFASDTNGETLVFAGKNHQSASKANTWETVSFDIDADGETILRIGLQSSHSNSDAERISGFDNFRLTGAATGLVPLTPSTAASAETYDLLGRRANDRQHGVYIRNGKKIVK